jgi:hypothetical protein
MKAFFNACAHTASQIRKPYTYTYTRFCIGYFSLVQGLCLLKPELANLCQGPLISVMPTDPCR